MLQLYLFNPKIWQNMAKYAINIRKILNNSFYIISKKVFI